MVNLKTPTPPSNTLVGRRVKIAKSWAWAGIYTVVESWTNEVRGGETVVVKHSTGGNGSFFADEYELLPQTKLEKALK